MTRISAISDPSEVADPTYVEGLRAAVGVAIAHGIGTAGGEMSDPPIPVALLAQARMAARVGIPLDTVLRRYFAGYSLLGYFILEEAGNAGLTDGAQLQRLLATHAGLFDRLLAAIGAEHARESEALAGSRRKRVHERVERLLAGEMIGAPDLRYDLDGCHLGAVGVGPDVAGTIRDLAARFDMRQLLVRRDDEIVWAWLGAVDRIEPEERERLVEHARGRLSPESALAFGEPGAGPPGWRLTHRQAKAILPLLRNTDANVASYAKHALLATVLQDEVMCASLREFFLAPLCTGPDEGAALQATLRAYFAAGGSISSTAAALGVTRRTVRNRLRAIEERIGGTVEAFGAELQAALRLAALDRGVLSGAW